MLVWLWGQNAILWNFGVKNVILEVLGSKCNIKEFCGQNVILGEFRIEM